MSPVDRLHPALAHHIVNTLGWRALRPLQEAAIEPLLDGDDALLVAPTAGGKTEAAFFPLLSRCMETPTGGLRILYVCPLRALLNNLAPRLSTYAAWGGLRVGLWHGDTKDSEKRKIAKEPPDVLLTTPESLEVMLVSHQHDRAGLFGAVESVVVDELHAFAGDDRGHHLLCVLDRVAEKAQRELQRIGLSATVGDPEALLVRFAGRSSRRRTVVAPPAGAIAEPEVTLDFVGNVENAALLLSQLHRGEKRLVFCDSRSRAESVASELRGRGIRVFVSHGSLGREDRVQSEAAFAEGNDCVIVATSTLELGVDVGDLDRVVQMDAPSTVASFLQRMGRTGRRSGTRRNTLFLGTTDEGFLRAAALERLRAEGWVEAVEIPPLPIHVAAQQVLAESLERGGLSAESLAASRARALDRGVDQETFDGVVAHLIAKEFLFESEGRTCFGPEAERHYGAKNYLALFAVFSDPPMVTVKYGRTVIGSVHESTFLVRVPGPRVLLLGGKSWSVSNVDWKRRVALVVPTEGKGRSRWLGPGRPLSFKVCRAMRAVLIDGRTPARLTKRGTEKLDELRSEFEWVSDTGTQVVADAHGTWTWWTFAGLRANGALAEAFRRDLGADARADNLRIKVASGPLADTAIRRITESTPPLPEALFPPLIDEASLVSLKFHECLPYDLVKRTLTLRLSDTAAVAALIDEPVEFVARRRERLDDDDR